MLTCAAVLVSVDSANAAGIALEPEKQKLAEEHRLVTGSDFSSVSVPSTYCRFTLLGSYALMLLNVPHRYFHISENI